MRPTLPAEFDAIWPNCKMPDCVNKVCLGLSETACFPHHFGLKMDSEGNAVYPNLEIEWACKAILRNALESQKICKAEWEHGYVTRLRNAILATIPNSPEYAMYVSDSGLIEWVNELARRASR